MIKRFDDFISEGMCGYTLKRSNSGEFMKYN